MPRLGWIALALLTMTAPASFKGGCEDAKRSNLHWRYFPIRDMRYSVALQPQKVSTRAPDTLSVPTQGREWGDGREWTPEDRDAFAARTSNPTAAADLDSSIARGEIKFKKTCVPCHGTSMAGNGPVAQNFMPPPDLLAEMTRNRKDGYLYSYIRHGGVAMPSYGAQVTAAEAWDLVNFIRHMQKTAPR